jgi:hypothetical protein
MVRRRKMSEDEGTKGLGSLAKNTHSILKKTGSHWQVLSKGLTMLGHCLIMSYYDVGKKRNESGRPHSS